jgi:hypothetical protein
MSRATFKRTTSFNQPIFYVFEEGTEEYLQRTFVGSKGLDPSESKLQTS